MGIEAEIRRAVKRIAALERRQNILKTDEEIEDIITDTTRKIFDVKYKFDFGCFEKHIITQNDKKRKIVRYTDPYSIENILCLSIKQILDKTFKIKYPNRNRISHTLFDIIAAISSMSDFTLIRFDFKDFFNSISADYAFQKFIKAKLTNRFDQELIGKFCQESGYCYAGLSTSNIIAEILSIKFDEILIQKFSDKGLIFYQRYIDDGILVFNQYQESKRIQDELQEAVNRIFHDNSVKSHLKCRTKLNNDKFQYISRRRLTQYLEEGPSDKSSSTCDFKFDFLGYNFTFNFDGKDRKSNGDKNKISVEYGITEAKQRKYKRRIAKIVSNYRNSEEPEAKKLELLRHRLMAFTRRTVYLTKHFNSRVWKVKGFVSNYGELREMINTSQIDRSTEEFLKNMIEDVFKEMKIDLPYFMKHRSDTACGYNLYDNLRKNKTLLLVQDLGYSYDSLCKLCEQINIETNSKNGDTRDYDKLVREYLIKVKVGY